MFSRFKKIIKQGLNYSRVNKEVSMEQAKKMIEKGAILIDVRSPQEYREGHLNGSISIPEYEIEKRIFDVVPNKQTEIIVYCQNGGRSRKAQKKLKKMGYENVMNLLKNL